MEQQELSGNATYLLRHRTVQPRPTNAFEHATALLEQGNTDVMVMQDIITYELKLANLSDDRLVMLYQKEGHTLTEMYSMAMRDKRFMGVFKRWFVNYELELATTRAKNAKERDMQGVASSGRYNPNQTPGYGQDLMTMRQESEKTKRTILDRLLNRGGNNSGGM